MPRSGLKKPVSFAAPLWVDIFLTIGVQSRGRSRLEAAPTGIFEIASRQPEMEAVAVNRISVDA